MDARRASPSSACSSTCSTAARWRSSTPLVKPLLPGPNWLKGTLFGLLFVLGVWPLTPVLDRIHPLIRRGDLPKFNTPIAFGQNIARHLLFGLVLGLLYRD